MGTKENPGQFDCYTAAKTDEPLFTLLARDPLAPFLVAIWGYLRVGDIHRARTVYDVLVTDALAQPTKTTTVTKSNEALMCANSMREWKTKHPEI